MRGMPRRVSRAKGDSAINDTTDGHGRAARQLLARLPRAPQRKTARRAAAARRAGPGSCRAPSVVGVAAVLPLVYPCACAGWTGIGACNDARVCFFVFEA